MHRLKNTHKEQRFTKQTEHMIHFDVIKKLAVFLLLCVTNVSAHRVCALSRGPRGLGK